MTRLRHYVGPALPVSAAAYDYMSALAWRDWAWEGLRRNPVYQDEARQYLDNAPENIQMEGGALLTRMHEAQPRAEAWALRAFR